MALLARLARVRIGAAPLPRVASARPACPIQISAAVPRRALSSAAAQAGGGIAQDDERRKRILYRCKQRGLLELDLIMGSWAEKNLGRLTGKDLDDMEALSLAESPYVLKWILRQETPPAEFETAVLDALRKYSQDGTRLWTHNKPIKS
jgi:antitoxin CptB